MHTIRCILDIGASPCELLIGAIDTNWVAVIYLKKDMRLKWRIKIFINYAIC